MPYVDLTGRAGLPTGDLVAFSYDKRPPRYARITGRSGLPTGDLVGYASDLRPFTDGVAGPVYVDMAGSFTDASEFTGALGGHVGGGGNEFRLYASGLEQRRRQRRSRLR